MHEKEQKTAITVNCLYNQVHILPAAVCRIITDSVTFQLMSQWL